MPDQLESALTQVGNNWDQMTQLPDFKSMTPDEQSKVRHQYFTDNVIGHPAIKAALPKNPDLGSRLHHAFMDEETAQMDQRTGELNQPWYDQPLSRTLLGVKAENMVDPVESPWLYGGAKFAEGMTTPKQLAIIGGAAALGPAVGVIGEALGASAETLPAVSAGVKGIMDAGFSLDMLHSAVKEAPELWQAFNYAQQLENQGRIPESQVEFARVKSALTQMGLGGFFTYAAAKGAKRNFEAMADWSHLSPDLRKQALDGGMDPLHPSSRGTADAINKNTRENGPGPGHPEYERLKTEVAKKELLSREALDQRARESARQKTASNPVPDPAPRPLEAAARPEQAASPRPGSPEYENLRARVAGLENTPAEPKEGDYLKHKLSVTQFGETFVDRPRGEEMARRSQIRFRQAMDLSDKLSKSDSPEIRARGETAKTEALSHLRAYGQYASPEDFKATLDNLETPLRRDFEDFKLLVGEVGRQLESSALAKRKLEDPSFDESGIPSQFPTPTPAEMGRILDVVRRFQGGKQNTAPQINRNLETGDLPAANILRGIAGKLRGSIDQKTSLVSALLSGKQGTSQLLNEINSHRETTQPLLGRQSKTVYPSPQAEPLAEGPIVAKAAKPEVTRESIKDANFNFAASATRAGNKIFGKGEFKVVGKQGKFRVEPIARTSEVSASPEVGRTPEGTSAREPIKESVQSTQPPARPGESVRAAEGPQVERRETPRTAPLSATELQEAIKLRKPVQTPFDVTEGARETMNRDLANRGLATPVSEPRSARGNKGLGTSTANDTLASRMRDLVLKDPSISLAEAKKRAVESMEKERGSLSLKKLRESVHGKNADQTIPARILRALDNAMIDSPQEEFAKGAMRAVGGYRARTIDQLVNKFHDLIEAHEGHDSPAELIAFNNAGEGKPGATFLHPEDQVVAQEFHKIWQDTLWPELKTVRPDKFMGDGIPNYLGRLFKGNRSQGIAEGVVSSRRPFEGRKGFEKHRVYEWIDQSIAEGAEPITNNPIKMQILAMDQVSKYISAHKAFNEIKDVGSIGWVKRGTRPPDGWTKINDSIFQPNGQHGSYYAHPDVAKVFNRWMAPGLRGNVLYDSFRTLGDTQNMMQLGFSAFHATFTTVAGSITSDVALGIQKLTRMDLGGLKDIVKAPMAWKTYGLGSMMEEEWLAPGTHPWLSQYADLAQEAGGRLGSGLLNDKARVQAFKQLPTLGKFYPPNLVSKGMPALAEWSSRWLMRGYVPRVKFGMFAKMAADKYGRLIEEGASPTQIRTEIGKIWDSVDNRAGLMVYDNRFINRTVKDLMQLSIRSTGWNWGTLQELLGGTKDIGEFAVRKIQGRQAELSARAAYTIALPIVAGALGATMGYLAGQPPQKLEDYFFPKTGGVDASGQPQRLSLPTYMRDVFSYAENAPSTILHKLHPMLQELAELYKNEDFYGVEIRHTGDDPMVQIQDVAKYVARGFVPISWASINQRFKTLDNPWEKAKAGAESELGFTPAPKYIGETKAEEDAYDLAKRHRMAGPKTQKNFDHYQLLTSLERKWDSGTLKTNELNDALDSGRITDQDVDKLFDDRSLTPFERNFKALDMDEALRVMKEATKDERVTLYPLLEDKFFNRLSTFSDDDADRYDKLLQGYSAQQ